MSGQVVLEPGLFTILWRDDHANAAELKARSEDWTRFKEEQQQRMDAFAKLERALQNSERRLSEINLAMPVTQQTSAADVTNKSYLNLGETKASSEDTARTLRQLAEAVAGLPAEFCTEARDSYEKIVKQQERLEARFSSGEKTQAAELNAFKGLITRTLEAFVTEAAARNKQRILVRERIEVRAALSESVMRNLVAMGYQTVAAFPDDLESPTLEAALRIPGGERLEITIQPDNQLCFSVVHEGAAPEAKMSADETARFRRQEQRWCADVRQLVRRLIAEGFDYRIRLENTIAEEAVKVVIVETPDEILAQEEADRFQEEDLKKYL